MAAGCAALLDCRPTREVDHVCCAQRFYLGIDDLAHARGRGRRAVVPRRFAGQFCRAAAGGTARAARCSNAGARMQPDPDAIDASARRHRSGGNGQRRSSRICTATWIVTTRLPHATAAAPPEPARRRALDAARRQGGLTTCPCRPTAMRGRISAHGARSIFDRLQAAFLYLAGSDCWESVPMLRLRPVAGRHDRHHLTACAQAPQKPEAAAAPSAKAATPAAAANPFFKRQHAAVPGAAVRQDHRRRLPAGDRGRHEAADRRDREDRQPGRCADVREHDRGDGTLRRAADARRARCSSRSPRPTPTTPCRRCRREEAPKLAAHQDAIYLNAKLFARVKAIYDQRDKLERRRQVPDRALPPRLRPRRRHCCPMPTRPRCAR